MNEGANKYGVCGGTVGRGGGEEDDRYTSWYTMVRLQRCGAAELRLRLDGLQMQSCSPTARENLRVDFIFLPCYNKVKEKHDGIRVLLGRGYREKQTVDSRGTSDSRGFQKTLKKKVRLS